MIYVSLGTTFNDDPAFFKICLDVFRDMQASVFISLGSRIDQSALPAIPENCIVKPSFNQLDILAGADLFITHGGLNSIHEALFFGVPMILYPRQDEQRGNAQFVQKEKAGLYPGTFNRDTLKAALVEVLSVEGYKAQAAELGKRLKACGGTEKALELIRGYIQL